MTERSQMLQKITEISFTVNDLTLYLDTHPTDSAALDAFSRANRERKSLLESYARSYEPLTMDCVCPDSNNTAKEFTSFPNEKHFTWADGPLPWEGGV